MVGPGHAPQPGVRDVSSLVGGGEREHSRPLAGGWRLGTSACAKVCFAALVQLGTNAMRVTHHESRCLFVAACPILEE